MKRHPQGSSNKAARTSSDDTELKTPTETCHPRTTPSKLPSGVHRNHQSELDDFANNVFSRSFNSLILDDIDDEEFKPKKLNKSPPFNVKQGLHCFDTIDDTLDDSDATTTRVQDEREGDGSFATDTEASTLSPILPRPSNVPFTGKKPLLKRSSKFFNLSIDSNFKDDPQLSLATHENIPSSLPLIDKSTPLNKFKRPHKLVSQSPSPSSASKHKSTFDSVISKTHSDQSSYKMFKNANKLRIMSPLKLSSNLSSSPGRREFNLKKFFKSPNSKFKNSSSPLSGYNFDPYNTDESPLKSHKKSSVSSGSNFSIYHDTEKTDVDAEPMNRSTSAGLKKLKHDEEKENKLQVPLKTTSRSSSKSSYKFVKPLQTAFESTGLLKKNSVPQPLKKLPPETPMKKNPLILMGKDMNRTLDFDDSYSNHDHSIEVGRNASFSQLNESNSSFFKIASTVKAEKAIELDLDGQSDLEFDDVVLETPTKLSSRGKQLNLLVQKNPQLTQALRAPSLNEPCTPILHMPPDSVASSQVTINLPSAVREASNDHTITLSTSSFRHDLDPVLSIEAREKKKHTDEHLLEKFGPNSIRYVGSGQFSIAFECNFQNEKFAIKRTRKPVIGSHERKSILREVEALRLLTSITDDTEVEDGKENLVFFIEAWSFNNHYYIMTEFCEGGTLYEFLQENKNYKIDEFRVWKILIEISSGLKFIHLKNFLHLDLKPANIFITFEGGLKIGDFGLCTKLPILEKDFDIEGDRNYIAPELLNDKIYTPFADIFSVGLIILEIATNIVLPGNGSPWRKLRSGDLSDAGMLSSDNISDFLNHNNFSSLTSYTSSLNSINAQPMSLHHLSSAGSSVISNFNSTPLQPPVNTKTGGSSGSLSIQHGSRLIENIRDLIPKGAPEFLVANGHNLDKLVSTMLKPNPFERPTALQILEMEECVEIENRRKAGATIFEGEFGPNDDE